MKTKLTEHIDFKATFNPLPARVKNISLPTEIPNWPSEEEYRNKLQMFPLNNIGFFTTLYNGYKVLKYILWEHSKTISKLKQPVKSQSEKTAQIQQAADFVAQAFEDAGIKINYYGQTANELGHKKVIYTSNHISWLDGFTAFIRTKGRMIGMQGIEKTPLLGKAFANVALVTVKRGEDFEKGAEDKKRAEQIATYNKANEILNNPNENGLVVFPEAAMSPGHRIVQKPKRSIFHALFKKDDNENIIGAADDAFVQPIAMVMRRAQGQDVPHAEDSILREQFAYYGKKAPNQALHLLKNVIPTSFRGGVELDIYYLPPVSVKEAYEKGFDTPAKLTDAVMLQIEKVIQNPPHLPEVKTVDTRDMPQAHTPMVI